MDMNYSGLRNIILEELEVFFSDSLIKEDAMTLAFINSEISESDYLSESLDEASLKDLVYAGLQKVFSLLKSGFSNIGKLGKKSISIAKKVWSIISKFCSKFGKACKVALILIILMLVTSATAYAQTTGDGETSKVILDAAIGFLEQNSDKLSSDVGQMDFMQAKTILYGIRDQAGEITSMDDPDMAKLSIESKTMAQQAIKFMENLAKEAKNNPGDQKRFLDYLNMGRQLILKGSSVI